MFRRHPAAKESFLSRAPCGFFSLQLCFFPLHLFKVLTCFLILAMSACKNLYCDQSSFVPFSAIRAILKSRFWATFRGVLPSRLLLLGVFSKKKFFEGIQLLAENHSIFYDIFKFAWNTIQVVRTINFCKRSGHG